MQDHDAEALEEALAFLTDYGTSAEWILDEDAMTSLAEITCDDYIGNLLDDEDLIDLELPTLREQTFPDTPDNFSQKDTITSEQSSITYVTSDNRRCFSSDSHITFSSNPAQHLQHTKETERVQKYSNRSRDARRAELVHLRQKVKDLQLQLDQIFDTHTPQTTSASFSSVAAPPLATEPKDVIVTDRLTAMLEAERSTSKLPVAFSCVAAPDASSAHLAAVWWDMAQQQAFERRKVERENVRLKVALEKQTKVLKCLTRALRERQHKRERYNGFCTQ
ncbi:unnamed protein product [Hyaloperonospora brassicae]|uniref:BZIP domain-containing protein n=1 Tax=Hyaloperonospora brassicae TaxID=162125 RepID=A0AAV0TWA6_HYABA|nr:unnamed protein product [Hyaloperonospora brassicae]